MQEQLTGLRVGCNTLEQGQSIAHAIRCLRVELRRLQLWIYQCDLLQTQGGASQADSGEGWWPPGRSHLERHTCRRTAIVPKLFHRYGASSGNFSRCLLSSSKAVSLALGSIRSFTHLHQHGRMSTNIKFSLHTSMLRS